MDERLKSALEISKFRLALAEQKDQIKLKSNTMSTLAINGGIFKSSPELISFVKCLIDENLTSSIMLDINQNPIKIDSLHAFYKELLNRYNQSVEYYYSEYTKIKREKNTTALFADVINNEPVK